MKNSFSDFEEVPDFSVAGRTGAAHRHLQSSLNAVLIRKCQRTWLLTFLGDQGAIGS